MQVEEHVEVSSMSESTISTESHGTTEEHAGDIFVQPTFVNPPAGKLDRQNSSPTVRTSALRPIERTPSDLLQQLGLGEMEGLSDVILKTSDGEEFPLHRACLANESRFFRELFQVGPLDYHDLHEIHFTRLVH